MSFPHFLADLRRRLFGPSLPSRLVESPAHVDQGGCPGCGGRSYTARRVVPEHLASTWELDERELAWLEDREGHFCDGCGLSRRVRMLLWSLRCSAPEIDGLDVLHINQVNGLGPHLGGARVVETTYDPERAAELAAHPELPGHQDIENLTFEDDSFDLVVHSETLEHVFEPGQALQEVRRVLRPGGCQVYTIPLLPHRRTRQRMERGDDGSIVHLATPSFHGLEGEYPVVWEFGGDYFRRWGDEVEVIHFDDRQANPMVFAVVERA